MKRLLLLVCFWGYVSVTYAHDFSITIPSGQTVYFSITDNQKRYVEVTFQGKVTDDHTNDYAGAINIPSLVTFNKKVYQVTAIGKKAFSGAHALKSIVLPSGVLSIGDFAFEGCSQLESVVFPGNKVRIGEGSFFRCSSISRVTLGSDWISVNLKMFRWSDKLTTLFIPAKLTRLQNFKSLKRLRSVEVDANNPNYMSVNGLLYTKDLSVLLACPRGYIGNVRVVEGTQSVRWGALIDCPQVTSVDLPVSLRSLSFREFSRIEKLERIVMRGVDPIHTATKGSRDVFLLKVAHSNVSLAVPKSALKAYKSAVCSEEGEYSDILDHLPEGMDPRLFELPTYVKSGEFMTKKEIEGVKSFDL